MSERPVKKIGKYEILKEIGRGGFAVVYKARDPNLDRIVALKVLAPHLSWDPTFAQRFRREAQATAKLRHPHIVTVYEVGEAEGRLYIAMTYLPGRTLAEMLKTKGAMPLERALPVLEQVADALDYAHRQGVIHRDVKPSNVMVEETERGVRATLMDFGLVKALESSESLTSAGTILGSPEYMAPEQADPDRKSEISPATDRYALGVVAYEMLIGRVPFPGSTPSTLVAHMQKPPPDPQSIHENLPMSVARVLLKALSKTPGERYPTARAMLEALRQAQAQAERIIPDIKPKTEKERKPKTAPKRFPVWGWVATGGLILALLIGSGGLVALLRTPADTPTPVPEAGATKVWEKDGSVTVYVPTGNFWMGSDDSDPDAESNEKPQHEVDLDAFWIDRTEVTNGQYRRCVADGECSPPSAFKSDTRASYYGNSKFDDYPVVYVDWTQAEAYCAWAGARLPTEAEWEKTARGDDRRIYPWGDAFDGTRLNFCDRNCKITDWKDEKVDDGYADTAPVGSYPAGASPYGALDMAGNVWEWTDSWWDERQLSRVIRGGSWDNMRCFVRAALRSRVVPSDASHSLGFRCARSASEP